MKSLLLKLVAVATLTALLCGCASSSNKGERAQPGGAVEGGVCQITATAPDAAAGTDATAAYEAALPNYLSQINCKADFDALASVPLESNIPGVRAVKFVIDLWGDPANYPKGKLYFQNSKRYQIHYEFVKNNIKTNFSLDTTTFQKNYYGAAEERAFYLGAISYYEGPGVWAVDLAGYDTATPAVIQQIFEVITRELAFFQPALVYHPASTAQNKVAAQLDLSIPVRTSDEIYAGIAYQPLSIAKSMGVLRFYTAADISSGTFIPYDSIVVLDQAPNDISVVAGIITEEFQAPLSHVNVLSRNRKTPNMGLRKARQNELLLKYKDQPVELDVTGDDWQILPVTAEQAEAYFIAHTPKTNPLPEMDRTQRGLTNVEDIIPGYLALNSQSNATKAMVRAEILKAVNTYGGKTANYAILAQIDGVPMMKAFGIPVVHYLEFMENNGLFAMVDSYLANKDPLTGAPLDFTGNSYIRQEALRDLRNAMMKGAIDQTLQNTLRAKLEADFTRPDGTPVQMRFRTSTNSEDLDGFPCAGCYESHTGDPANWENVLDAIRLAYSSAWLFRTFEERKYYGVDHKTVGMALLVHPYFPHETANGVAITANINDLSQTSVEGYTVNVAYGGDVEVVAPPDGVTTDQFIYYVGATGNPVTYLQRWNQPLPDGRTTVLTEPEIADLAAVLTKIKNVFKRAYTLDSGWYAMDVEFKFAPQSMFGLPTSKSTLWIKQARPYPDPNTTTF